ncbi:hypothetical protein [Streptosporangium sp. NPDC006930]|uniref:hypothetical protein n=1 Tax=unclassified Streptosporangium TaxID=2632669 RepID=UPI003437B23E
MPGLIAVGIYTFMISWNEYLFALTLTRTNDMRTVPIGIQPACVEAMKVVAAHKLDLFGAAGKGSLY